VLALSKLSKTYMTERGPVEAVKGVDLDLPDGGFTALVGASGSGKSSLLAMIGGLSRPTAGAVLLDDIDIWTLSDARLSHFRNCRIGFVFQFSSLLPTLRIVDNVALPALLANGRKSSAIYQRASELLERLGVSQHLDAYPAEISAGEQRRAVIARALINSPALLLADEPTSDVDAMTEGEIMEQFRELTRTGAVTLIMVTHNLRLAEQADRIVHIAAGSLVT
jgi:ABC-type lipoprotein export system ATPase subunit